MPHWIELVLTVDALLGASVWRLFEPIVPSMGPHPMPYVMVGMMTCLGGISRAAVAIMLMAAEMTGGSAVFVLAMVAVEISWLIVRSDNDSIVRSQLEIRDRAMG